MSELSRLLGWSVAGAWALLACGGSVANDGGSGGSGASAGSGASSSGGASVGGTGGVATGGSGGVATGGTGGVATGGSGGTGGTNAKIAAVCKKIEPLPCNVPNCLGEVGNSAFQANQAGCGSEFDAVLDCALAKPLHCVAQSEGPQLDAACNDVIFAFEACMGSCEQGASSNGECYVSCTTPSGGWGAKCFSIPGGGLKCTCTDGPAAGKGFSAPGACDGDWTATAETICG